MVPLVLPESPPVSPDEAAAWFHATDIGVLPFEPCPFTHNALPLKVLEYGAARKTVLASPLKELQTLQLPHVRLLPLERQAWAQALLDEAHSPTPWEPAWDAVIERYDWPVLFSGLKERLLQRLEGRA